MVYPQAAYLLREYFEATNWSLDNHYHVLTLPSRNLLDFPVPPGLHLALSHRPTPNFLSHLNLSTLVPTQPTMYPATPAPILSPASSQLLAAQLTYVHSSAPLALTSTKQNATGRSRVGLQDVVQSFRVGDLPLKPELRDEARATWQRGKRVDKSDYLMYGRLYVPNPRLDALYVHRFSNTLQALVSLITVPSPIAPPTLTWATSDESPSSSQTMAASTSSSASSGINARMSELEVKLQQDYGRWSAEYSYAFGDGMWGARGLYNFGKWGTGEMHQQQQQQQQQQHTSSSDATSERERVVDEEEEVSTGGLKGRWSAGGEVFFSAQERSAGVSTGVRFCTLPDTFGYPLQPPTIITATLNPIMGQLSTAYSVGVSPDTALGSRFDFNLYSYDADLTVGGEWFQRRKQVKARYQDKSYEVELPPPKASFDAFSRGALEEIDRSRTIEVGDKDDEVVSVVKFRASSNTDMALLWEGRVGDFLVSLGLVADLRLASRRGGRTSPIKSVGLGVQYWA
ncbi:Mitochondrial distribution and morphology protein 10 [Microbotryomycetes sp. JL221]|nr:Mitochondrial distribution and morphology protein 10 [Microbotryomycetes sp. JL221]